MALVKEILDGTKTLLTGMKVTLDNFRKPPVTSQYPMEKIEMTEAFRNVMAKCLLELPRFSGQLTAVASHSEVGDSRWK